MRFADWEQRLEGFISANRSRPFKYGSWDCCLFVCGAIEAMTGVDPAQPFRGRYSSRKEARAAIREIGGESQFTRFIERITAKQGMREVAVLSARRGDVILIANEGRRSVGIVALDGKSILMLAEGIESIPLGKGLRAWRV